MSLTTRPGDFRSWLYRIVVKMPSQTSTGGGPAPARGTMGAAIPGSPRPWQPLPASGDAVEASLVEVEESLRRNLLLRNACEIVRARVEEHTWRAFWLTSVGGASGKEAAERLGMAITAVHMAKSRVRKMLREEVEGLEKVADNEAVVPDREPEGNPR